MYLIPYLNPMSPGFAVPVVYQNPYHLFLLVIVSTSNSLETLSDITADLSSENEGDNSLEVEDIGSPTFASSPKIKNRKPRTERNKGLRALVINTQSILKKKESLFETINVSDPDIIVACEPWLSPEIADTEVLPENHIS